MKLVSARTVADKQFSTTRLKQGYDPDEVDTFLDEVAETVRELYRQNQELAQQAKARATDQTVQLPAMSAQRLLDVAQRAADEIEAEANHKAATIAADAAAQAEDVARDAQRKADEVTGGAYSRKQALEDEVVRLAQQRADFIADLKNALEAIER